MAIKIQGVTVIDDNQVLTLSNTSSTVSVGNSTVNTTINSTSVSFNTATGTVQPASTGKSIAMAIVFGG